MKRLHVNDPGQVALRRAVRVTIVWPLAFAIGHYVVDDTSTALYCAFGAFGLLSLTDFGGPLPRRFFYYCVIAGVSVVSICVATLCSQVLAVGVAGMAVAAFLILFAGLINGYVVAMTSALLLMFVLPVTVPGPPETIPYRLAGFGIAWALSVPAALFLWPYFARNLLRPAAADACDALAAVLDSLPVTSDRPSQEAEDEVLLRFRGLRAAQASLRQRWLSTPFRPTGPTTTERAVAHLVDELDWLYGLVAPRPGHPDEAPVLFGHLHSEEEVAVARICADVLRECAAGLRALGGKPHYDRVHDAAEAALSALERRLPGLDLPEDPAAARGMSTEWLTARAPSFRLRAITYATASVAADVTRAIGEGEIPGLALEHSHAGSPHHWWLAVDAVEPALSNTASLLLRYFTPRSVWFRNSVRGAVALAAAVAAAGALNLQHGFWVVLAALTVLRTNAAGTQATALRAVAGTLVGFAIGAAIVSPGWSTADVLWAVWPVTIFLAAWGGTISLVLGQAAFTVMVVILFNLLGPGGWKVAAIRVEDVLVGCAVALGAGVLFWPHGAGSALVDRLAAAYRSGMTYLAAVLRGAARSLDVDESAGARHVAVGEAALLDDAVRQYLSERGTRRVDKDDLATLTGGASRVRMIAHSLSDTVQGRRAGADPTVDWRAVPALADYSDLLDRDLTAVQAWYATLADALSSGGQVLPPFALDAPAHDAALLALQHASAAESRAVRPTLTLVLIGQHLDYLARLELRTGPAAERVASWRTLPWWR